MKRHIIYSLSLLMACAMPAAAQDDAAQDAAQETAAAKMVRAGKKLKKYPTRKVSGRVVNGLTNQPLAGAIVSVPEIDGYSTLTRDNGAYEIEVPTFAAALSVTAPDMNNARLGLGKDQQQRDVKVYPADFHSEYAAGTNILASKTTEDFRFTSAVTIDEEIQKRLGADAHTTQRNGTPGVGGVMFLNGLNSLNANAQPLIVIDGVIYDQQYSRTMLHDGFYNNILANISPSDIEKVTVMKNGTALYGAKGANGVILIQTRRNHSMATRITASLSAGVTMEPLYLDVMNASQYKSYASDLLGTTNTTIRDFKFFNEDPSYYYYPQYHNDTDWKEELYRTAITQNYNINVEGGDDVANYNLSLGYASNQSTLKDNGTNRLNIRFNTNIQLTRQLSVLFDASFTNQTRNLRDDGAPENYTDGTPTAPSFLGYAKSPMLSPYSYANGKISSFLDINDEDYLNEALANYSNYNYKLANPIAILQYGEAENKNRFENSMFNLSVKPKFEFNSHLALSEHFSYNIVNTNEKYYIPLNGVPDYYVASVGAVRENETRSLVSKQNSVFSDTRLDWANRYAAHDIHVFGGARVNWENYTLNSQLGYNTGNDKTPFISSSLLNASTTGTNDNWASWAWYLQAEYNYLQRYYLQANLTAETSSRFGEDAKDALKVFDAPWGIFYGLQGAWVVSNEKWFAPVSHAVNYLKVSAGYDVSGNDDVDYYAARSYFRANKFMQTVSSLAFENIGNTELQWETTKRFSAGLEANFLGDRLNLRFNYFLANTDNLITYQALNYLTGLKNNWGNSGSLRNQGFDVTAVAKAIAMKDFQWELGASLGHYKNEITSLGSNRTYVNNDIYGATVRSEVGKAANLFYGYKTKGVFATSEDAAAAGLYIVGDNGIDRTYFGAGDMIFDDINGDHEINDNDRTVIGDPNPDIYGNIFTSFIYKRLRLDLNFNYSLGNDVYNYMRSQLEGGSRFMNQTTAMTRRWQTEGQQTDVPKATFQDPMGNSRFSDRWIEDGSYLRLKTITLSYTLPMRSQFLQGLQFWIQANNLLTFTKYYGSDPEFTMTGSVLGQGIDLGQLPQCRSFLAGVKINL